MTAPTERQHEAFDRIRDAVPHQLLDLPVWLLWKHVSKDGRWIKKPYYCDGTPRSGTLDTPADRARLRTFDEAAEAVDPARYTGFGVALGDVPGGEVHLSGIDLDDVTQDDPRVLDIMAAADSYAEVSPSGNGIKIFGTGPIGTERVTAPYGGLEIYQGARFFTVTGRRINGAHLSDLTSAAVCLRVM